MMPSSATRGKADTSVSSVSHAGRAQINPICAAAPINRSPLARLQNGGSVRGYQAIFVPLAALSSPGYSPVGGQPAVYLYIAALEANCPLLPR
jgi:hypothetical protein